MESSYLYNTNSLIGIYSEISLKEWNDVDGKVADCYKIGNLFLYLLGKLHIRDNNILTGELKNLLLQKGINSNIYKLIEYLLSENSDIEEAINMIRNDIYSYHFQCTYKLNTNIAISDDWNQELVNIISLQDTLITKYNKILDKSDEVLMQLKSEVNLGLNGLAGVLFYLSSISYDNEIIEKGIDFILESLVEDSDGNRGVLISENSVSPYLSNGTAGIVQLLIYVNSDKYIKDIKNLSESLLVEFAQFSGLWNGMLGIAMTLLQVFRLTNDTLYLEKACELLISSKIMSEHHIKLQYEFRYAVSIFNQVK